MSRRATKGIFCLEGEWRGGLEGRLSVEPQLRMLVEAGVAVNVIHRDAATFEELRYYIQKWTQKRYERYSVAYLAFHGEPGTLLLDDHGDTCSLENLAEMLGTKAAGRILYFGSCSVLAAPDWQLKDFCQRTQVRGLAGFTKDVDWLEAAAFDFILLPQLLHSEGYFTPIYKRLLKDHERFVTGLGLRLVTKSTCTPL